MKFRPCIDIHNGKVKQIVGSSLVGEKAKENYVSEHGAAYFAEMYRNDKLAGGHIVMLNGRYSPYYEETKAEALSALRAYPGGLMVGGGITPENAKEFLNAGASHVVVTSFVFVEGKVDRERLTLMKNTVGRSRLVLDLSCRKKEDAYVVASDQWQSTTSEEVGEPLLSELAGYADEFLVHAVDMEGKRSGIEEELVRILGEYAQIPVTYAGGVRSRDDLIKIKEIGKDKVDATIGSALDIFGGTLKYDRIVAEFGNWKL